MASTILQVLGVILILIICLIVFFAFYFWRKIKKFVREVARDMATSSGTPQTIHLNEIDDRDWLEDDPARTVLETLSAHGYVEGKVYEVAEMASALVLAVANPENGTLGGLYCHNVVGVWIELTAQTENGYISYTNSSTQAFLSTPDWLEMHILPDKYAGQIVAAFEERVAAENIQACALDNFRDFIEANYKRLMKWKNEQGGLSFEEVKMQNDKIDEPLDEEKLQEAYMAVKISEFNAWEYAMWEELHTNPALEYTDEPTFIVPDHALCEAFVDYLDGHMNFSDKQVQQLKKAANGKMACGRFFDAIMKKLSANLRPKEYCRIEFPLNARVFIENDIEINELEAPED